MNANILCQLLAQRIDPTQFRLEGLVVMFNDPDQNSKPVTAPHVSPYDTPENRAIVQDVVANYDSLAAELFERQARLKADEEAKVTLADMDLRLIRGMREWVAKQADAPQELKNCEAQAIEVRSKILK